MAGGSFVIKAVLTAAKYGAVAGFGAFAVARVIDSSLMPGDIYLPVFNLTPEEIFADEIWLFDVNFFEPESSKNYKLEKDNDDIIVKSVDVATAGYDSIEPYENLYDNAISIYRDGMILSIEDAQNNNEFSQLINDVNETILATGMVDKKVGTDHKLKIHTVDSRIYNEQGHYFGEGEIDLFGKTLQEVGIFVLNKNDESTYLSIRYKTYCNDNGGDLSIVAMEITVRQSQKNDEEKTSVATELKGVISKWYYNLTNLAILLLLIVLIYSGIRIVIGSTAGEKAKYKERIMDWLVAMCLVFIMHYIMVFAVTLNEKFVELIDSMHYENGIIKYIHLEEENQIEEATQDDRLTSYIYTGKELDSSLSDDEKYLQWSTNLMGGIRIEQQLVNEGTANWIGYCLCYLVLVAYTVIFSWTYLRRVLYMAFLTMIAPLVAMTYPIDKITDGKAQAFNSWLREYIFNLLIQPFHLLLYTVLVTSAWELAGENALYALVAIGFMTPAEKLLRKFFGFEKAQTPGLLGGAAGAALAMSGLQSLMRFGDKGKNPENDEEEKSDIKFSSADSVKPKDTVLDSVTKSRGTSSRQVHEENVDVENDDVDQGGREILRFTGKKRAEDPDAEDGFEIIDDTREESTHDGRNVRTTAVNVDEEKKDEEASEKDESVVIRGNGEVPEGGISATKGGYINKEDSTPATSRDFDSPQKRGFRRAVRAGIGGVSRAYGQKTYKRMKKAKPIRALARGLAGVSGGLLFGMAGLALGIASGDPSKAFQYTTAGVTGGFGVGKGLAGMGANALSVSGSDIKDEMELAYYGADYKDEKLRQEQKALEHDEEAIKFIMRTCGVSRKEAKHILATTGARCYASDIKNIEDIATIYQYEQEEIQKGYANIVNKDWEGKIEEMLEDDDSWKSAELSPEDEDAVTKATDAKIASLREEKVNEEVKVLAKTEAEGDVESYRMQRTNELNEEIARIKRNYDLAKVQTEEGKRRRDEEIRLARKRAEAEIKKRREELIKQQEEDIRKRKEDMEELRRKKEAEVRTANEARIKAQYEESIRREKARKQLIQANREKIDKDIVELRKEMLAGNTERYQEFKEKGFISGVVMSKYAKRVPDNYNQLGQDKVDKIDARFYKEIYDDAKNKRGMNEEQAEAAAKEATKMIHSGIRQYMDKKENLFTAN